MFGDVFGCRSKGMAITSSAGSITVLVPRVVSASSGTGVFGQFGGGGFGGFGGASGGGNFGLSGGGVLGASGGTASSSSSTATSSTSATSTTLVATTFSTAQPACIANPAGGGSVGLTKNAEGNSPLPRDRLIFDYDFYSRTPLTANGVDVSRFSLGAESTFFNGRTSVEIRLPFASTLSSDLHQDDSTNHGRQELGDLHFNFKWLVSGGDALNVAAGLGLDLPTADDVRLLAPDGTTLVHVSNDSVLLSPYVAYLWTPNDRLFFQNWFQYVFDTNGNGVDAVVDGQAGLFRFGRINQQGLVEIDAQLGYWVYRPGERSGRVRALAPFVELHYNVSTGHPDEVVAGPFSVGSADSNFSELNLSAGVIAQLGNHFLISLGGVAPLRSQPDRSFDWQFGIRGSFLFGGVGRASSVSAF
jgi:hypothetical protein